jgi:hypothetical protein
VSEWRLEAAPSPEADLSHAERDEIMDNLELFMFWARNTVPYESQSLIYPGSSRQAPYFESSFLQAAWSLLYPTPLHKG